MTLFLSAFVTVFALAFQQQNVTGGHYRLAILTAFIIAGAQFVMIRAVAFSEWWEFLLMAGGAAVGVVSAMYTHKRWVR